MPQLNPDDAAEDESKLFNYEAMGGDEENDLNDIKGDLCGEDDVEPIQQSYNNKVESQRSDNGVVHRRKENVERDQSNTIETNSRNFSYSQQDVGPLVPGFNPLFSNGFMPSSSQVAYPPYMSPYMGSFFCGGTSPIDIDGKQMPTRTPQPDVPPMYSLPGQLGQIPNPLAPWSPGPLYPLCTASAMAGMLRYPYPFASPFSTSGAIGSVPSFSLVPPHHQGGAIHPNMLHPGGLPFAGAMNGQNGMPKTAADKKLSTSDNGSVKRPKASEKPNRPYVKKPLNAFMLYMKEQRAQVVAECTLKESAAINQILGKKWHSLKREEQQKYYEMARKERQLHMQMFPGWSARDNYGKRKKRKKEKTPDCTAQNPKKCRAVFGLDQQQLWCAPCRRKKKCIRYKQDDDDSDDSSDSPGQQELDGFPHSFGIQNMMEHFPSSNSTNNSLEMTTSDGLSPGQSNLNECVKIEKSSPLSVDLNSETSSKPNSVLYHSPTISSFSTSESNPNNTNGSTVLLDGKTNLTVGNSGESVNTSSTSGKNHRSNTDSYDRPSEVSVETGGKLTSETRDRRQNCQSNSPFGGNNHLINRKQNLLTSQILSPGMNLASNHSNHNPFLPNLSYFAAANLPTSPLGGLMGFPNFKGLSSQMGLSLKGPGSSVDSGPHSGPSGSRYATSALEGKS